MESCRVLIVEDDDALRTLFSTVLDLQGIAHAVVPSAEAALEFLTHTAVAVIVTDLLLPGMDGRSLLRTLQADPARRRSARLMAMSGSVDAAVQIELKALGAWRVLAKPLTVKDFKTQIQAALDAPADATTEALAVLTPQEQAIVADQFAGMESLFVAYRQAALQQLPKDLAQGDAALASGDTAGLRRVAHNLKSVMRTLGHESPAALALALEDAAERGDAVEALARGWAALRQPVARLSGAPLSPLP